MFAQAGLDQLVGPLVSPLILIWLVAAGFLFILMAFGLSVVLIRKWNRRRERRKKVTGRASERDSQCRP